MLKRTFDDITKIAHLNESEKQWVILLSSTRDEIRYDIEKENILSILHVTLTEFNLNKTLNIEMYKYILKFSMVLQKTYFCIGRSESLAFIFPI